MHGWAGWTKLVVYKNEGQCESIYDLNCLTVQTFESDQSAAKFQKSSILVSMIPDIFGRNPDIFKYILKTISFSKIPMVLLIFL